MHLGHKQTDAPPLGGQWVTVRTGLSGNEAMKTQSPQIISHPARTIRFRANPQPLRHMIAQVGIAKPLRQQPDQTQRLKQSHETVRVNTGSLPLLTSRNKPFDLLGAVTWLKRAGTVKSWPVEVAKDSTTISGRVCAIRKTKEAIKMAHEKIRNDAARKTSRCP
jgi:hypothetical protein